MHSKVTLQWLLYSSIFVGGCLSNVIEVVPFGVILYPTFPTEVSTRRPSSPALGGFGTTDLLYPVTCAEGLGKG